MDSAEINSKNSSPCRDKEVQNLIKQGGQQLTGEVQDSDSISSDNFQQFQKSEMKMRARKQRSFFRTFIKETGFLHTEGTEQLVEVKLDQLRFSRQIKSYSKATLNLIKQKQKWWVILPAYTPKEFSFQEEDQNQSKVMSDVQMVLTGRMKKEESPIEAIIRQTKEEIGLDVLKEDVQGLGKEGQLQGVPDSRGNKHQIFPNVIEMDPIKQLNLNFKQGDDVNEKSIQSWILIRNPKDPLFLNRKRNTQENIGKIVVLIRIEHLCQIISEFRKQEMWKRRQNNKQDQNKESNKKFKESVNLDALKQLDGKLNFSTHKGSRETQQQIKKMSQEQRDQFVNLIQNYASEILQHFPGNYIIQVLFEYSNTSQRLRILKKISPQIPKIIKLECGLISCSKIIHWIDVEKQAHLFEVVFNGIFEHFVETSKEGYYFLRHVIKNVPIEFLLKLRQKYIDNLEVFKQLITNSGSIFILQDLLQILHKSAKEKNEKAKQMKKKMIQNLGKCLQEVVSTPANYFIHLAYQILTPHEMKKITKILFRNLQNLVQDYTSYIVASACVEKYWNKPYYEEYYQELGKRIQKKDIKQMFECKLGNRILRKLLMMNGQFQIKDKITNYVMERAIKGDRQKWMEVKNKLKEEYQKVNGVWVWKKL